LSISSVLLLMFGFVCSINTHLLSSTTRDRYCWSCRDELRLIFYWFQFRNSFVESVRVVRLFFLHFKTLNEITQLKFKFFQRICIGSIKNVFIIPMCVICNFYLSKINNDLPTKIERRNNNNNSSSFDTAIHQNDTNKLLTENKTFTFAAIFSLNFAWWLILIAIYCNQQQNLRERTKCNYVYYSNRRQACYANTKFTW